MSRFRSSAPVLLLLLLGAAGCDGLLSPASLAVIDDGELTVASVSEDAPPLLATEVAFWAVRGEEREVRIDYESTDQYNGKCLRFVVPAEALLRGPDGEMIQPGDSVEIRIRVLDAKQFLFEFDPGGLLFDSAYPARLEVRYAWVDLNGDGVTNAADFELSDELDLWRQENPGDAWQKLRTRRLEEEHEIHAEITGFTRYALASDRSTRSRSF